MNMTVNGIRFTERPPEVCRRLYDGLTAAAASGTVSQSMLAGAMRTLYVGAEGEFRALLLEWAMEHCELFGKICDAGGFLFEQVRNPYIVRVLDSPELLRLVSEHRRAAFVGAVIERHGPHRRLWWKASLEAGIDQAELAEMVMKRLQSDQIDPRMVADSVLVEFFTYDRDWPLLSNAQILALVKLAAASPMPSLLFIEPRWIQLLLGRGVDKAELKEILVRAAARSRAYRHTEFVVAEVEAGQYNDRPQLEVNYDSSVGSVKIVRRYDARQQLKRGDLVRVSTAPGRVTPLGKRVWAGYFERVI